LERNTALVKAAREVIADTSLGLVPTIDKIEAGNLNGDQAAMRSARRFACRRRSDFRSAMTSLQATCEIPFGAISGSFLGASFGLEAAIGGPKITVSLCRISLTS
jgi:hypothetical protein